MAVEPVTVYTVNPDRATIPAKSSCQVEFFGFSAQPGQVEEHFTCSLGNGVKSKQIVFDITVRWVTQNWCCNSFTCAKELLESRIQLQISATGSHVITFI